ncbi:MAG: hypothetical protein DWI03_11575 [Planctomycetota bacterium]|jgi:hypothetical protein|nr:MAG: hypothetical protein DWI03_11575 [Planctomycetota bacterium]
MVAAAWVLRIVWFRRGCLAMAAAIAVDTMSCVAVRAQGLPPTPAFDPVVDVPDTTEVAFRNVGTFPAPDWTSYALTDALYWGRDNQATNRPLLVTVDDGTTLVSARDLQFPWSAGVRAFYGQRAPDDAGWELGYFGVWGQSASQFVSGAPPNFIQMPEPIGSLVSPDGETALLKYTSQINSAELNVFRTRTDWRNPTGSWLTTDWLVGFRYVGVEEQASITIDCCFDEGVPVVIPYGVRTRNNLFGAQVGNRSRWTWERWAFEGWAKAGLFGNAQEQSQDVLLDVNSPPPLRPALSSTGGQVSFVGDINTSVIYRLTDVWGLRAGYNLIWIDGLALAPNQFDFSDTSLSGSNLVSGGGIFMSGANLGLEARW